MFTTITKVLGFSGTERGCIADLAILSPLPSGLLKVGLHFNLGLPFLAFSYLLLLAELPKNATLDGEVRVIG